MRLTLNEPNMKAAQAICCPAFWWGIISPGIIAIAVACNEQWKKTDRVTV